MAINISDLVETGLKPRQVYEICLPEGDYRQFQIDKLPRGYESTALISDESVESLKEINVKVRKLPAKLDLLIVDISDIVSVEYSKDAEALQRDLLEFYGLIMAKSKLGMACVVFVNFFYYDEIFRDLPRSDIVQIQTFPSSEDPGYWEARIVHPPKFNNRRLLFNPINDEISFVRWH